MAASHHSLRYKKTRKCRARKTVPVNSHLLHSMWDVLEVK